MFYVYVYMYVCIVLVFYLLSIGTFLSLKPPKRELLKEMCGRCFMKYSLGMIYALSRNDPIVSALHANPYTARIGKKEAPNF